MRERPSRISLRSIRATRFADSRANLMGDTISPETPASLRAAALAFDLRKLDRRFLEDPYPVYRALREHDPVHRMPDGSYFLSRYEDCAEVYRDPACWSSDKKIDFRPNFADSLLYEHHTTSLVFNDPPYHTRVRPRSRRARSKPCSRGSRRWSIACSTGRPSAGVSISSTTSPPRSRCS